MPETLTKKKKTPSLFRKMITPVLRIAVAVYLGLLSLLFFFQHKFIYMPHNRSLVATPSDWGLSYENVILITEDKVNIHGWFIPATNSKKTILFFHGNGGNISRREDTILIFHRLGLNCFIIDYRGYGQSQGKPSEQGTYLDAQSAWQYLTQERQIPPDDIIISGRSLGAAIAAYLAKDTQPAGVILESAFTSVPDMGSELYPFLPIHKISRFDYNAGEYIQRIRVPVLIIHSPDDDIVPYKFGKKLFELANEPKTFLQISGDHNYGFMMSGETYLQGLREFLDSLCSSSEVSHKENQ